MMLKITEENLRLWCGPALPTVVAHDRLVQAHCAVLGPC